MTLRRLSRFAALAAIVLVTASVRVAPTRAASPEAASWEEQAPTALRFDGSSSAPSGSAAIWRQLALELEPLIPRALRAAFGEARTAGSEADVIPIAVIDLRVPLRVFIAAPLRDRTHRGEVEFALDRERWVSPAGPPAWITLDCGDGQGPQPAALGGRVAARYTTKGAKRVVLRAGASPTSFREARFELIVEALDQPRPDDTLHVVASLPYEGAVARGSAYVYLGQGNTRIERPILVPEGFDLANNQYADELYALLDRGGLATRVRELGYDLVVFDFEDATDHIQRNAFALVSLLQQVQAGLPPDRTMAVVGPSIGGVIGRYALAWMEAHDVPHRVDRLVTLDAPHGGANVPLGLQHWFVFFGDLSATADYIVERINRPAARQILLEHFRPGISTARGPDPLRGRLLAELETLGWPQQPRRVAIANGSGAGARQGFQPGDLLLRYDYRAFLRRVKGHVWALPDQGPGVVFDGEVAFWIPLKSQTVVAHGTQPLDDAPGGYRNTMLMIDTTAVPLGDIVAIHPAHCFVPTTSALALDLPLRQDLRAVPDLGSHTPFDTTYFPFENQEHVELTPENSAWFERELTMTLAPVAVASTALAAPIEATPHPILAAPNPFAGGTTVRFRLPAPDRIRLTAHDLAGRLVATLAEGIRAAGTHDVVWETDAKALQPGVYLVSLEIGGRRHTVRVVRTR